MYLSPHIFLKFRQLHNVLTSKFIYYNRHIHILMTMDDPKKYFLKPQTPTQRRYEALRAHFVDDIPRKQVSEQFGYTFYTLQALVRDFLQDKVEFFVEKKPGPATRRTPESVRNKIIFWRKKNLSAPDIQARLEEEKILIGERTIERILQDEGFAKLPRRTHKERGLITKKTYIPEKSRQLDFNGLSECRFDCQVAGIFYFIPYMIQIGLDRLVEKSLFPGTSQLSALNSVFSILSLKLIGKERLSNIVDFNFDYGFGFFAGLNILPKSWAISTYSYRIDKQSTTSFMHSFVSAINNLDESYYNGKTINLDFHSIPHFGDKSVLEKHWISSRNKAMKSALTFLAQDGESKKISYVSADIKRSEASEEILNFVDYWLDIKGVIDQTLVFDSKLTTYAALKQLDSDNIKFLTLRRRGEKLIENAYAMPREKWEKVDVDIPKRKYNKFLACDHIVTLSREKFDVREIIIREHGREKPTFIITNNYDFSLVEAVTLYARRWRIENTISDLVDFFSLNALSSPIMIRIHFDVLLTMVADTLYKLMAEDLKGFEDCTSGELFSKFINTPGKVIVDGNAVTVKTKKRAHTPILKSNDVFRREWEVPWWNNKILKYEWVS